MDLMELRLSCGCLRVVSARPAPRTPGPGLSSCDGEWSGSGSVVTLSHPHLVNSMWSPEAVIRET